MALEIQGGQFTASFDAVFAGAGPDTDLVS